MAVKVNPQSFLSLLLCPGDRKPLTTAVNLFPCCHKVNQVVAENYFGKIVDGYCELKGKNCFLCNTPTFSWAPDPIIRALASRGFGHNQDLKPTPPLPIVFKEKLYGPDLLYPGDQAFFECSVDRWEEPFDSDGNLCREIVLRSATKNSPLTEFSLLGYNNGYVTIHVEYAANSSFGEYLFSHGLICDKYKSFYIATTHNEVKILFRIITSNNVIPKRQIEKMSPIVILGRCPPVQRTLRPSFFNDLSLNSDCGYL